MPVGGKVGLGAFDLPPPAEALSLVAEPWIEPVLQPAPPLVVAPPESASLAPAPPPAPAPTAPPSVEDDPGEVKPTQIHVDQAPIVAPVPGEVHQVSLEPSPADAVPTLAPPAPAPSDLIVAPEGAPAPADPGLASVQLGDARPEDAWKGTPRASASTTGPRC